MRKTRYDKKRNRGQGGDNADLGKNQNGNAHEVGLEEKARQVGVDRDTKPGGWVSLGSVARPNLRSSPPGPTTPQP